MSYDVALPGLLSPPQDKALDLDEVVRLHQPWLLRYLSRGAGGQEARRERSAISRRSPGLRSDWAR